MPPELLEIEVTEGAVMEDTAATLGALNALRERGVRIARNDFGTGYSSMGYLKRMPLNNLKIDRTFINGLPGDDENRAIVRAILSMAKNLGLEVTAEGVETAAQADALHAMTCENAQGWYFSKPVRATLIPDLLRRRWPPVGPFPGLARAIG